VNVSIERKVSYSGGKWTPVIHPCSFFFSEY